MLPVGFWIVGIVQMYFGVVPWRFRSARMLGQCVDPDAVLVERRADDVDPEAAQFGQIAAIGELFEDHRVARFEQHLVDQVDRLAGA